jgi:hypothetical protein
MHALLLPSFAANSLSAHDANDIAPYMLDAQRAEAEARAQFTEPPTLRRVIAQLGIVAVACLRVVAPIRPSL